MRAGSFILRGAAVFFLGWEASFGGSVGWEDLSRMREAAALEQFEKFPTDRTARLGVALSLLNLQPKTGVNLDRAETILREIETENANDTAGVMALYFRARLAQVHRLEPDLQEAAELYEKLITNHRDHPFAQNAVVKLAILRLFSAPITADRAALLQATASSGASLTFPPAVRDFHLLMADVYARWEVSDAESLAHLLAAYRSGSLQGKAAGDVCVRIGELSRLQGQPGQAAEFYQRFLDTFPRDSRGFTIRQRLEALQ